MEEKIWQARGTSFLLAEKWAGHGGENDAERGRVGGGRGARRGLDKRGRRGQGCGEL